MARLKVFVVPIGFHDAYVAAPSRKAALAAWGSDHDLFARGIAREVTDPSLTAEPLASPGTVIKRSRGSAKDHVAALPPDAPRTTKTAGKSVESRKTHAVTAKPEPRPSRDGLDAAERALREAERRHRAEDRDIAQRQAALDRERHDAIRTHANEHAALADAAEAERARYERAIKRWRG